MGDIEHPEDLRRRFEARAGREVAPDACRLWQGPPSHQGYGYLSVVMRGRKTALGAHRVALLLEGHVLPAYSVVMHRCDRRLCVALGHLSIGTTAENVRDAALKGRMGHGQDHGGARLTAAEAEAIAVLLSRGENSRRLAAHFAVSYSTVYAIGRGLLWRRGRLSALGADVSAACAAFEAADHAPLPRLGPVPQPTCKQGHPYDAANTHVRPADGARVCRACSRRYTRAWQFRRAQEKDMHNDTPRAMTTDGGRDDG